jgi:phosphate transport system substrate-binding protein
MNIPKNRLLMFTRKRSPRIRHDARTSYREALPFLLIPSLLVILMLASCGGPAATPASSGASSSSSQNTSDTATSGQVKVIGSTAMLPLVSKAADLFHQSHPNVQVNVAGGGSVAGLEAVTTNKADIGDSDIYADPSIYPDPNLTDHIICATSFVLIADPQINISSLTTQQIRDIFSGRISDWKDVGGPDLPIHPVIRPSSSGTRTLFEKYVLGGATENGNPLSTDSSSAVLDAVAHTSGAIGYVTSTVANSTVQTLAIDGISPTTQNIQSGKYKFWGYEHMYTLQNGVDNTTAFLDFMQSPQVQSLAQQLGYISVDAVKSLAPTGSVNG